MTKLHEKYWKRHSMDKPLKKLCETGSTDRCVVHTTSSFLSKHYMTVYTVRCCSNVCISIRLKMMRILIVFSVYFVTVLQFFILKDMWQCSWSGGKYEFC